MVDSAYSVFLFTGEEDFLKEKAIDELKASLLDRASGDADYKVLYGSQTSAREILEHLTTLPFLSSKRLVVVKDFEEMPKEEMSGLISYVSSPSKMGCLVLDSRDEQALVQFRQLGGRVRAMHFGRLKDFELVAWIRRCISSKGKNIDEDALLLVREMAGDGLSLIAHELEKLAVFVGEKKLIALGDVQAVMGQGFTKSAFDLGRAISSKKADEAVRILLELGLSGERPHEIVGLLCWHFKRILRARRLKERGESDFSIAGVLKIGRRFQEEFFAQAAALSLPQLKAKIDILLEADLDIKRTKLDPGILLETAVMRLCLG